MASLNKVFLLGNLTRDPELRYTPRGTAVCDVGMAVNRSYTGADGASREETCFVDLVFWGKQAELVNQYLKKGSTALVEGRLQLDRWETADGQKRSRLRVVCDNVQFLGRPRGADYEDAPPGPPAGGTRVVPDAGEDDRGGPTPGRAAGEDTDDDIPF